MSAPTPIPSAAAWPCTSCSSKWAKPPRYCNTDRAPHPINQLPGYGDIRIGQIHPAALRPGHPDRGRQRGTDRAEKPEELFFASTSTTTPAAATTPTSTGWSRKPRRSGELVYELGLELGVDFSRDIAFNLYAAIASDTGSFKYSNTTPRVAGHRLRPGAGAAASPPARSATCCSIPTPRKRSAC